MIPEYDEIKLLHHRVCRAAVGDPRRIQIVYALGEQPLHVNELATLLEVSPSTISRHLSVLRGRAMVMAERDGQMMIYVLTDRRIIDVLDQMREIMRDILKQQVELGGTVSTKSE